MSRIRTGDALGGEAVPPLIFWSVQDLPAAAYRKNKLADCPAAVQKTIKDNANGGTIVEVEKETNKDGTSVYEAEVKRADGSEMDIEVAEDGRLIKIEVEQAEDDDGADNDDSK